MGGKQEITITDAETIKELYKYLGMVKVDGETNESITDCYHYVQFKLADDQYIHYSFEGTDIWCYGGKNYRISNSSKMFGLLKVSRFFCIFALTMLTFPTSIKI